MNTKTAIVVVIRWADVGTKFINFQNEA